MSLWSNTDANTSVPKFAPSTVKLENTQDNSNLLYANTTANAFITGATIVFSVYHLMKHLRQVTLDR